MAKKKKKTLGGLIKSISSGVKKGIKKVGKVIAKESANARRARGGSSKSSGSKGKSTPAVQKYSQRSAQVRNAGGISSYKATQKEKKSVSKAKQTNWNNTFASRIKTPTGTTVADNMRAVGDYKRAKYGQSQSKQQQKDTRTVKDLQSWNTLSVDRQRQIGNMGEKNLNKAVNRYQNYYKVAAQQEAEKNRYKAGADPDKADSFLDVVRDKAAGKNGLIKGAGEHISEHYLKPLSKGKIGTVAMNALNDVGETTDYMALPLRALASQDNYVYGSKRLQSRKLIDGQTAWVYSGGKGKQKKLIELGAEKILNPNVRATYLEHKKEKAAIHEAGLDEEFEKFAKEYKERNHKKRNFGEKLKEAATTHKNYDPDSGNKALDIVVGAAGDPTTYLGIGAVGAAAKGAKAGAKAVGKAAAKKAGKEAAEIVEKGAVKNAVKAAAETGARKAGKEAVQDISGEVAKARVAAKDATKAAKPAVTTAEGREAIRIKAKMDAGLPVTEAEKKLYNDVVNRSVNAKVDKAGKEAVEARQAKQSTPNAKVGSSPKAQRTFSVKDKAKKAYATAKAEDVGTDSNLSSYVKESEVPEEMKPIFSAYKKSTNEKIKNAVINLRNGRPAGARTFEVGGTVKTTEGEVIKNLTGVDVTGYKHVLDSDRILHIEERHGIVGQENTTMKNANDIARVGYVIDNPDSIEYALDQNGKRRVSYQYGNSNHEPAPLIQYKKRVNGDIVVIEAVPDVSAKKLRIESMYFDTGKTKMPKNINGNPQVQNANNLPRTSKTESGLMPDSKIPPAEGKVNTLDPEYAEYAAKNRVKEPVSEGSVTREVASPMESEGRTLENVGKRNVKAYQFEHPEVKPYFESEARVMLGDLRNSVKGEKSYSNALYDVDGMGYTGTKRQTTEDIAALLDGTGFNSKGYSYQEIEDALEAIIKDNGAENNAASKRVEMMLDERLRNGYTSYDGLEIPASQEYIDMLHAKGIDDYGSKVFNERVDISNSSKLDKAAAEASDQATKIDSDKVAAADMGPEPTAVETNPSLLSGNVSQNGAKVNVPDADWEKTAKDAVTNMEKDEAARAPEAIKEKVKPDSELFDDAVKKADYEAEAEKIMSDNPKMGQNAAKQNVLYYTTEEANSMFFEGFDDGLFRKSPKMSQKEAREKVANMAEGKSIDDMARQFIGMDYTSDPHLFGAMAEKILPELSKRVEAGDKEALKLLMEVSDHANSIVSHGASMTNAAKMWVKMTPIGRCKAMDSEIARLNKQYGDRLKKPLELTDEQKALIYKAQTDEEIGRAVAQVTEQIWDEIPSTFWEKVNTARHIAMLLNIKTNLRNVAGNTAFASVRAMSNGLEYVITKSMKKTLDKYGGNAVRATRVTSSEMKGAKTFLDKEFDLNYSSNSNKYKDQFDMSRPEGKTVLESKVGSNVEKFTYWTLEKGDIAFFKPEYQKSYARYCKSKGIPLDKMSKMTELQRKQANIYAMKEAEKATFRETTSASRALTKLKDKTATGKGKSVAGTAALRAGNAVLESTMPFVKTPINVFRQSVDYSPFGLLKSANEMITFKKHGNVEALENAIHHMSTGLTGSGLTVLGAYLYSHGIVSVKAGEKSGDEYYDRDMGYQDYSLVIGNKSITIDWASPMQSSFFMGAQMFKMSESKGMSGEEIFDGLLTLVSPHMDASFMSGTKDMMELFIEEAGRDGNGLGSAILKTVGGSIPQNFISTLLPFSQLMSQTAGFTDDYQRDTRSTKEGTLEKSWDSWGKKMINRIPGLRQKYLNPKLDRRGRDVKSLTADSNVLTKFANAFINPSNVKQITLDDTDREIIKIYKGIDTSTKEGKSSKKHFFYNFTGNPDYDLTNGKRMTYDEAYTYGKSSRGEQNNVIQDMLKASSYKNMTNQMKVDEIKSSYFIGQSTADMKTYGAKYACESLNRDKDAYKKYEALGGKAKDFMNVYLGKEKLLARAHDTTWYTKALAIEAYGGANKKNMRTAFEIKPDKVKLEREYLENHGSIKEYSNAMCKIVSTVNKSGILDDRKSQYGTPEPSMAEKAVAAAYHNINNRTYKAMGLSVDQANMGIWFKDNGYSLKALDKIKDNGDMLYDLGNKDGVIEYIDSLNLKDNTEKACLFRYLSTANNPYGSIPNYLDMEDDSSGGSYGRRGYSRRGHRRGGGSGSGSSKNSNLPTWEEWVKQYITTGPTSSKSSGSTAAVKTVDSYLSEAYRKKQRKLVQKSLQ